MFLTGFKCLLPAEPHFTYPLVCGCNLGCFHCLAVANGDAVNMGRRNQLASVFSSVGALLGLESLGPRVVVHFAL